MIERIVAQVNAIALQSIVIIMKASNKGVMEWLWFLPEHHNLESKILSRSKLGIHREQPLLILSFAIKTLISECWPRSTAIWFKSPIRSFYHFVKFYWISWNISCNYLRIITDNLIYIRLTSGCVIPTEVKRRAGISRTSSFNWAGRNSELFQSFRNLRSNKSGRSRDADWGNYFLRP